MDNGCQELGEKKEGKLWLKVKTKNKKETKNNQGNKQTKNILYFLEKKV